MIEVWHDIYGDRHYLRIRGHASEGDAAQGRRVCASVSTLAELLATELSADADAFASLESGDALLSWAGHEAVWLAVEKTLERLSKDFSKNLSYTGAHRWAHDFETG